MHKSKEFIGKETAEILLKIKAVTLNVEKPYRYVSGILSPIYTDNRLLISYPKEREKIINFMAELIKEMDIDIIAGTATAGIPHAAWLAEKLDKPMIYVSKEGSIVGKLEKGKKVLLIEDLISTGKSSIEAIKIIKQKGEIKNCLAIFTYGMEKAKQAFTEENIGLITLTDFSTMINIAIKNNYIKEEDKERILDWAKNPETWGQNELC